MQAAEFDEGVAVIDIQLARILIERGQFATAEAVDVAHCGPVHSSAEARVCAGSERRARRSAPGSGERCCAHSTCSTALRKLAGSDANLIRPRTARVRARALALLGRGADAEIEIDNGLVAAREHALRYDEALLLAHTRRNRFRRTR